MSRKVGLEQYVSVETYEEIPHLFFYAMRDQLARESKEAGFRLTSMPEIQEVCYYAEENNQFYPVGKKRSGAAIVCLYMTAEAELIRNVTKIEVIGHEDGCTYPDTRQWCDEHMQMALKGEKGKRKAK